MVSPVPTELADPKSGDLMDRALIRYDIDLCVHAGFLWMIGKQESQIQLTWAGHEELESRRNR